jgi:streptogramin lyase
MLRTLAPIAALLLGSCAATSASAQMQYPLDVAARDNGEIFVADRHLPGIWKIVGDQLSLFFEGSPQYRTPLNAVRCLALDGSGNLLAGDSATRDVYRITADGQATPLTAGAIGIPIGIAVGAEGELFVADLELHRIWQVAAQGGKPTVFAEVSAPRGVALDRQGRLWVVSHGQNQLLRIAADGTQQNIVTGRPFQFPHHIVLADDDTAYLSDGYAKAIWKIPPGGKPTRFAAGSPLANPVGLAWRGENLLVADPQAQAIFQVRPDGKLTALELQGAP